MPLTPGIANLDDIESIEVEELTHLPASTYELLKRTARAHPLAPALSFFMSVADHTRPRRWNYRQFFAQVTRTANAFHHLGASKESVIAIVLPNLPETHFAVWGGQATGIAMPINYLLEPDAIADLLQAAGVSILVTAAPFTGMNLCEKLLPALASVKSLRHVLLVDVADGVIGQERIERQVIPPPQCDFEIHDFAISLLRRPGNRLLSGRHIDPEDYSSFLCTGGTTGAPKIAMRRHANEVANAWSVSQCLGDSIAPGKNLFCGLPLFHANGLLVTGLLPFAKGAHVVIGTPLGYRGVGVIENFWSIVEHHKIHFFSAVPTIYGALLQIDRAGHRIDSLEYGICGAAPMPRELIKRFEHETGVQILEGYGLTEGTCVSSLNPPQGERRAGSIGLRVPGQEMKVVVLDTNGAYQRDAIDHELGVLIISGRNVFAGYLNESQNSGLWLELGDDRRWLLTGDLGYRDPQGYFWLTGRAKDLIIRGGHNIDPAVIEMPLHAHPGVLLAAAVGRPDAHAGEVPVAYVQAKPSHNLVEADLKAFLEEQVGERAAMPRAFILVEAMPLTAIGKINKPELRRKEMEFALCQALIDAGIEVRSIRVESETGSPSAMIDLSGDEWRSSAEEVLASFPIRWRLV